MSGGVLRVLFLGIFINKLVDMCGRLWLFCQQSVSGGWLDLLYKKVVQS